jgi:5,10-methenyltetrahydrofolate synthetase
LVSESIYPPDPALAAWRKAMRAELLARRDAIPLEERRRDDARITGHLLAAFPQLARMTVGFYWPMKGEFDPRVAILRLREQGARAALPVVVKKAAPLEFREWWPGIETVPGVFGLPVPQGSPVVRPDACLIPPVGFDEKGYRLGYGGGYFDRTLAALSPQPLKIAVARGMSRIDTIHPQPYDIPMDFIVTEAGVDRVTTGGLEPVSL